MDPSRKDILSYAASCNPPRRAKRPSTGGNPPAVEERASQPLPPLAPAITALSTDVVPPVDDDDFNTADVPQPKRRGRKPSSLSRAARESMRRQNHSRIEKARRTKINEALSMLRDLVPADAGRKPSAADDESVDDDDDEDDEFGSGSGKKPPANRGKQRQEKEFKLEILEKAVSYVQELQEKVRVLEVQGCVRCSSMDMAPTHYPKRKRDEVLSSSSSNDVHDPHLSTDVPEERPNKRLTATQVVSPPILSHSNTRLPSISSWLPKSVDSALTESQTPPINPIQLPTPPASAVIGPITSPQVPPALRLELPMASLTTRNFSTPTKSAPSSPSWTQEDESVASLLLRIKSSSSPKASRPGSSVSDLLAPTPEVPIIGDHTRLTEGNEMRVQTPGSLLGLTSGSK